MKTLTDAIERMRETQEEFNGTISDLDHEMRALRARMVAFDRKMGRLGRLVGQVGDQSRSLADTMTVAAGRDGDLEDAPPTQREIYRYGLDEEHPSSRRRA